MLEKYKYVPTLQIPLLLAFSLLSGLICYFYDFYPRLRFSFKTSIKVIALTFLIALVVAALLAVVRKRNREAFSYYVEERKKFFKTIEIWNALCATLVSGAGEEIFMRAFLFDVLDVYLGLTLALAANAVLTFALYFRRTHSPLTVSIHTLQATLLAIAYYQIRSVFVIVVTRIVIDFVTYLYFSRFSGKPSSLGAK